MSFMRESDAEPIPGYRLIEPLGSGGFGEVWKCEAPGGLLKAIKFVFGNLNSLDVDGARAEQELNALNRVKEIRHPFILGMERIEIIEGELVIVMELADKNLHDAFVEYQSAGLIGVPRDDLMRFMRDSAEALDYMCEKHGLQHLDIKPRNLFLVCDRVKVADFGLVKHLERTGASGILGGVTPLYAAPETFSNKISERSDQYSLAIVYMELLTTQRPFNGKNARQLAQQHINDEPELRSLPEGERAIVGRALSKDPAKRFPSCLAFVRALYNARSQSVPAKAHKGTEEAGDPTRRKGNRPKSMADTMEDIQLEQVFHDDEAPARRGGDEHEDVDLGGAVPLAEGESFSNLGITAAQPNTGCLRPTIVLGLGSLGKRAMFELRCRFLDRFGDLSKLPLFRFMYLDSDRDALQQSQRGAAEISLQAHEVFHLPLQPMAHYRRRQLDQIGEWMPREKLYAMPRNLQTQGSRALGRLAFTDNYLRLLSRLKREIQAAVHPDALYQSVANSGLALRDATPRIVVVASACGGASGYLIDLAYTLRRVLRQLRQPESSLNGFLFCGAPDDPATPSAEQANLYATLLEINHYSDGVTSFTAQYGADSQPQVEQGAPFDAVYLLTQKERTPTARREVVAHAGSYLYHELITPLGPRLERERVQGNNGREWSGPAACFRSFGTHGVWFPRGLLLRQAARLAVANLVRNWAATEDDSGVFRRGSFGLERVEELRPRPGLQDTRSMAAEVDAAVARVLADTHVQPTALTLRIEEIAAKYLDGMPPAKALAQLITAMEEQCWQYGGPENPASWASQALTRVRDWLGGGVLHNTGAMTMQVGASTRKSRLTRALENACSHLAEEWDQKLTEAAYGLMDLPGMRVAAAETFLSRMLQTLVEAAEEQTGRIREQAGKVARAEQQLQDALQSCSGGGSAFRWLVWRPQRPLRMFLDLLAAYARQCLAEDTASALVHFYQALQARLRDRQRDLSLLRQRLRHIQEHLTVPVDLSDDPFEDRVNDDGLGHLADRSPTPMASLTSFWEMSRGSSTTRVVLPDSECDLDQAAAKFVASLGADHWAFLDQALQEEALAPRGGLTKACFASNDVDRVFLTPLVERAANGLSQYLPVTDVAQVELAAAQNNREQLSRNMNGALEQAAPLVLALTGHRAGEKASAPAASTGSHFSIGNGSVNVQVELEKLNREDAAFLLLPGSEAGKTYGDDARQMVPLVQQVKVPGQSDLMFCREMGPLTQEELEKVLGACRQAYNETVSVPTSSPHSRFDTRDWVPLEP